MRTPPLLPVLVFLFLVGAGAPSIDGGLFPRDATRAPGASALAAGASVLLPRPAALAAQQPLADADPRPVAVGGGPVFQHFRFGEPELSGIRSISLLTLPVAVRAHPGGRVRAEIRTHWARGTLERADGSRAEIDGLTDTELRFGVDLVPDALTVTGVALLPTGADGHDPDQVELAGAVAADLLPFRISHWGSGGGAGVSLIGVHSFGLTGIGAEAGYRRAGEFRLSDRQELAAFRPGDVILVTAAVDRVVGPAGKVTLRLDGRRYGDDRLQGNNLFRSGSRIGATGSYSFAVGPASSAVVYAGYRHRSAGTFLTDLEQRPSQGLLLAGGGMRVRRAGGVIAPSADVRILRREDGIDQGWGVGVGAGGEWTVGALEFVPAVRFRFGSVLIREGETTRFTGFDVSVQARSGSRR